MSRFSLGRLTKGLLITTDPRGLVALKLVPAGVLLGIGLFFTDLALLAPLVLALALALYGELLYLQWRAEQDGRAAEDWRRHEEARQAARSLPVVARVAWVTFFVLLFGFFAWTAYRFEW